MGNARIAGAGTDLGLTVGNRFSVATVVFFPPYILLELPSNLVLRKVGAAKWLATIAFLWGIVTLSMGFVQNWQSLAACRALLGALEAGFFPACIYLISTWYVRAEVQKRLAAFYLVSAFVGGFGNILAYGFSTMKGLGGYNGWRWIFIMEGIITVVIAAAAYFLIVDFPDKNNFLTAAETELICARIEYDRGDAEYDPLTWEKAKKYALDLKIWAFALMFMGITTPAYAFAYFNPIILNGMGYNVKEAQLLSTPPAIVSVFTAFGFAYLSDRYKKRAPFIVIQCLIVIIGLALTAYAKTNGARYFGVIIGFSGCAGNVPAVLAYQCNNIVGQSKRSFSSAMVVGFGGIGGIFASLVFRQKDYPRYIPGLWAAIACQLMMLILVACTTAWFMYRNQQVQTGNVEKHIEGQPGFTYTL